VIRVKDPETGSSKPKWFGGFATEDEAKAARDEARVKARHGEYIDRSRITVAEYLNEWIEAHAVAIKPKTLQDYRHLINRHVTPHIGALRLQAVRPARITTLYRDLAASGGRNGNSLSPRTIEYVHAVLRKAFRDAVVIEQLLPSNPVERAKRPRKPASEPGKVWNASQLHAFLETAATHRLFAFYRLAAYTGARRGELLHLRWRDIDLARAEIRITGSAAVIAGQRIEGTTKSGRSRTISIDAETVQVLREHRKPQTEDRMLVGSEWKGTDDYVFTTSSGEPVHPDTVSSLMASLIDAHNRPDGGKDLTDPVPHARLHDLRHLHATILLGAGVPVHVVAARLGHADPSITLRVYAHVVSDQLAEAADIFARAIGESHGCC
jgi:integrase